MKFDPNDIVGSREYTDNGVDQCWKCKHMDGIEGLAGGFRPNSVLFPVCGKLGKAMTEVYHNPCKSFEPRIKQEKFISFELHECPYCHKTFQRMDIGDCDPKKVAEAIIEVMDAINNGQLSETTSNAST